VADIDDHLECLDIGGFWAVVVTFEGKVSCVRLAQVVDERAGDAQVGHGQSGRSPEWAPLIGHWRSSLDETAYLAGVSQIRDRIAAGEVYQVNLCRVMSHPLADDADLAGLETLLARGNPAPYAGSNALKSA